MEKIGPRVHFDAPIAAGVRAESERTPSTAVPDVPLPPPSLEASPQPSREGESGGRQPHASKAIEKRIALTPLPAATE